MNMFPLISSVTLDKFYLPFLGLIIHIYALKLGCGVFQIIFNSLNPFFKQSLRQNTIYQTETSGVTLDKRGLGALRPLASPPLSPPSFLL